MDVSTLLFCNDQLLAINFRKDHILFPLPPCVFSKINCARGNKHKKYQKGIIKYYFFKGIKESNKTCKVVGQTGELRSNEGKGRNIVWFKMNLRFIVQDPFCLLSVDLKCYSISSGAIFSTSKRMSNLQALFYNFGKTRYPWLRSIKQRQKH